MFVLRQYLVVVFRDKPLELWDVRTGTLLREMARNFPTVTALVNAKLFLKTFPKKCVNQSPLLKFCSYKQQVTRLRCNMWFKTHMLVYYMCKPLNFIFCKHTHTHAHDLLLTPPLFCPTLQLLFFMCHFFQKLEYFAHDSAKNVNLCQARGILINEELCWINFTGHKIFHCANKKLNSTFRPFKPQTAVKFPY